MGRTVDVERRGKCADAWFQHLGRKLTAAALAGLLAALTSAVAARAEAATGAIRGRVLNYAGEPFEKPSDVILYDAAGRWRTETTTDDAGNWSIDAVPDTYTIEVLNGHHQFVPGALTPSSAARFTVEPGGVTVVPDERLLPHTDVFVFAVLDGASVPAFSATIDGTQTSTVDGLAVFFDLHPGAHEVTVSVVGHPPATASIRAIDREYTNVTVTVTT